MKSAPKSFWLWNFEKNEFNKIKIICISNKICFSFTQLNRQRTLKLAHSADYLDRWSPIIASSFLNVVEGKQDQYRSLGSYFHLWRIERYRCTHPSNFLVDRSKSPLRLDRSKKQKLSQNSTNCTEEDRSGLGINGLSDWLSPARTGKSIEE